MSAQHTPGPWQVVKGAPGAHPNVWEIASDLGDHEYEVVGWISFETRRFSDLTCFDDKVIEANSRLIAAAPELLVALQKLIDLANSECDDLDIALKEAEALVSKAIGREE